MVSTSSFFVESKRESLLLVSPAPLHELRTLQSLDRQPLTTATTLALFPYSLAPQEKWKGMPLKTPVCLCLSWLRASAVTAFLRLSPQCQHRQVPYCSRRCC